MVPRMKTTIEIADAVLDQARAIAARDKTTLKALVDEALRKLVADRQKPKKPFKLKDLSYGTGWLSPGYTPEMFREIGNSRRDDPDDLSWMGPPFDEKKK